MAISFNTEFYLEQKLAQLQENGETGFETTAGVAAAFEAAGLTAEAHYEQYGLVEGLNPNEDFDTNVYLSQKLAQLQEDGEEFASVEDVIAAFAAAGLSPLEHYNQYGAAEALSPNAEFNVQAYLEDKLAQLQADGVEGFETTDDVLAAFQEAGLTPLDHFQQFGEEEGLVAQPLPTDTSALTEVLENLQTEQANLAAKLAEIATADATDETAADGVAALDPESATYEADLKAIVDGYDSEDAAEEAAFAAQAVEDAQGDIDAANGTLLNAQAATVSGTADGNAVVAGLESFTANTRATDANIARAVTEAQALVEADEASYTDAGVKVSDDGAEPEAGYVALYTDGQTVQTTEATGFELIGFADEKAPVPGTPAGTTTSDSAGNNASALTVNYSFTTDVATDATESFSVIIDSVSYTVNVTDASGVISAAFATDPATSGKIASTDLTVDPATGSGSLTITGETGADNAFTFGNATGEALTGTAAGQPTGSAADAAPATYTLEVSDASFTGDINLTIDNADYTVAVVEGVFNTDDLAAIEAANAAIATAEQDDNSLVLTGVVANGVREEFNVTSSQAIPDTAPAYTENDLLDVYSAEELQTLAAEAQADLDTDVANDGDNVALLSNLKDTLVTFIANGGATTTVVGNYTVDAPVAGVQAAALIDNLTTLLDQNDEQVVADDADAFVETLTVAFAPAEPTDNEQLLIDSLEVITDRADLEAGVVTAENALDATESGAVLDAANNLQAARDQLMQDITDAQDDKVAAEDYQATIDALVAEHDGIVGNIEDIRTELEELGVENLVELGNTNTGGTLLSADLFVYTEETENLTISRFEADDQLFLGDFGRVDLGAEDDLSTDRLGDSAALEFFVEQDGNNVLLHIETQAFAGNDTGAIANSDFTTIELSGVQSEDVVFENGYLTVA